MLCEVSTLLRGGAGCEARFCCCGVARKCKVGVTRPCGLGLIYLNEKLLMYLSSSSRLPSWSMSISSPLISGPSQV